MDQIAPFIITRFSSQPDLLGEACRVMSIAPIDFIGITLPRTLPELFATFHNFELVSMISRVSKLESAWPFATLMAAKEMLKFGY